MSFTLATTPTQETVHCVAAYLDEATGCSRALALQNQEPGLHERQVSLTLFHARSVPTIDLDTYMSRILKYCPCESEVFLALIVYMQQMIDRCARHRIPFTVDAYSIHRLVITAVAIASKCFSDVFFTNSRYSKVGGLSLEELNTLELQFLSIIDFDLNIRPEVLQALGANLFSGRLPLLTNAHIAPVRDPSVYLHMPASAYRPAQQLPAANAQYPSYAHAHHHADPAPWQQPPQQQPARGEYPACPQRAPRRMSYPGPNGIYYSNPYYYGDRPHAIPRQAARKQEQRAVDTRACGNPDLSSGSTLASTPPNDSLPIDALRQGAV
ncbi:cyclin-like protein interacting with PHO85 [Coemansia biformis]|uniref:Cyclin-like protein interacting with PHO85 n=1 Tax=Coemansia biformis TaxID=1286918 RepID=A0A9W7YGF5_9FUNG|nr:cyclin-like protein interacting with PHO85 [Coemansia biformis]